MLRTGVTFLAALVIWSVWRLATPSSAEARSRPRGPHRLAASTVWGRSSSSPASTTPRRRTSSSSSFNTMFADQPDGWSRRGTTTSRAPCTSAPKISYTEKSKAQEWNIVHTSVSSSRHGLDCDVREQAQRLRCGPAAPPGVCRRARRRCFPPVGLHGLDTQVRFRIAAEAGTPAGLVSRQRQYFDRCLLPLSRLDCLRD